MALDGGHHGDVKEKTNHGLDPGTDFGDNRDLRAVEAILDCAPTELHPPSPTCYESCCAIGKRLNSAPQLL